MSESKKIYDKAMKNFQNGKINKALEEIEKAISLDMKNSSVLNLKGLLLYLKGDFKGAEIAWKINKDFNDDSLSKSYLKDLMEDNKKILLYEQSIKLMKELKINEALVLLETCRESDFNTININNALSFCYIKKGEYENAYKCIEKVMSIDVDNKIAKDNMKVLKEFNFIINKPKSFKPLIVLIIIFVILGSGVFTYKKLFLDGSKENSISIKEPINNEQKNNGTDSNKVEVENDKQEPLEIKKTFNSKELKSFVDENNLDGIYEILKNNNKDNLDINEKAIYENGESIMKSKGVESFYNKGREYFKNSDFGKANNEFIKAYNYVGNEYLRPHIIYFIALSYEKLDDYENSLKYYDQYAKENEKGDYIEEVLYKLATIYYKVDKEKGKEYALRLTERFPKSMYRNTTIKDILK